MSWKCDRPEVIRQPDSAYRMVIPCGYCLGCNAKWRKGWVLRMLLEQQSCAHATFLTLTYDPSCVPEKLDYADISGFLKRLRKNSRASVRFFSVGEYGGKTGRPHWHLILFSDQILMEPGLSFLPEWPHGGCVSANAEAASMAYVAGYSMKKRLEELEVRMSRRPGLGLERGILLAQDLYRQQKHLEQFPTVLRVGKHLYPMHRKLREVMQEAYLREGGKIDRVSRLRLAMDIDAGILVAKGGYRENDRIGIVRLEKALIKDAERRDRVNGTSKTQKSLLSL